MCNFAAIGFLLFLCLCNFGLIHRLVDSGFRAFFGRLNCPEILNGLPSADEIDDIAPPPSYTAAAAEVQEINDRMSFTLQDDEVEADEVETDDVVEDEIETENEGGVI